MTSKINLKLLGQSGFRIEIGNFVIYVDPYLSNSVEEMDGTEFKRLVPIPIDPSKIFDADWVLITHDHMDHCDPNSLPCIAKASPNCSFLGPPSVIKNLNTWGISRKRCRLSDEKWSTLKPGIQIFAVPASHPEILRNSLGQLLCVGYLIKINDKKIYISGDTSVTQEMITFLKKMKPISVAIMPVNEHNFFREQKGIIGNMSIREAFQFASELDISNFIPVHWDMFAINSVNPDEIESVYNQMNPKFELIFKPSTITL